ncbi:putative Serine carboxypeptidase [Trypanosoma vivax]|uniref:Carboxypeptidase n=1 Tax=Trypanosoma vivax (strain Y486) TaxID=1055687 RepID=G0U597_TRYVY|nr:putative serine carboxypeptidase (CBP1) [Trypanosoma vivax]KAH8618478.1 putative Serine carboxypeptidase [Trypanosoma vivax]CCC51045.1 putative serine carboxypeptidase (CBP1) [Trypanosoma vivax Y486]
MRLISTCTLLSLVIAVTSAIHVPSVLRVDVKSRLRQTGAGWKECDNEAEQWSGYFDIPGKSSQKHYFFWAFGPRSKRPDAPVLLWMTGGPGCSSIFALLAENGPCLMNESSGKLVNNKYSWNEDAYVIYVDQPAGVGFSYASKNEYDSNETQVSDDMYHFVQAFFNAHSNLRKNDFFVVGESYGGHYAPATAYRINEANKNNEGPKINLAGLAVGNGFTDPYTQSASYPTLAWEWCKKKLGSTCVGSKAHYLMKLTVPVCQATVSKCNSGNSSTSTAACKLSRYSCAPLVSLFARTGLNVYDIRKECDGDMCYNFQQIDTFMNRKDVQISLGAVPTNWKACNDEVYSMFDVDFYKNFNYTIPALLKDGIRVMIYAGDCDFICNWIGNKAWVMDLEWPGKIDFEKADDKPFHRSDGSVAGLIRSVPSTKSPILLSFVQVYDAGHMVPMDQPESASVLINNFMKNKPLP